VGHHLDEAGAQVAVYLAKHRGEDDENLQRLKEKDVLIAVAEEDQRSRVLKNLLASADIVVDAVLGTGFRLPLKGAVKDLLGTARSALEGREIRPFIVAVDCPSGLDCDTGEVAEETLSADLTVTLAAAKPGLLSFPGASMVGEILIGDIGIAEDQKELSAVGREVADPKTLAKWLPMRPLDAHKGTFGRAMIVAGSINFPGAAALCGIGAYRAGAGLVTMAVPSIIQGFIAPILPEATWVVLPHEMGVINEAGVGVLTEELKNSEALLIGPGFGRDPATKDFISKLMGAAIGKQRPQIGFVHPSEIAGEQSVKLPATVIDADGLKLLAEIDDWHEFLPDGAILTPHPGEMSVMTGKPVAEIQKDRIEIAREWSQKWGAILVLKGAFTVVASPEGRVTVIPIATPALARAGTGDVLAGAITGFLAQGLAAYEAAILGCYVHGRAGEYAAEMVGTAAGVIAGEVAEGIPEILRELEAHL
jgi:NAD(P)H-hydrate epimerase